MKKMQISRAFTLIEPDRLFMLRQMTISWTMVMDLSPIFAITTGPWNYTCAAVRKTRECVSAIPAVDLLDKVVGVGTCCEFDTDRFEKFKQIAVKAKHINAPLLKACVVNIEGKVVDIVNGHNIVVGEGVAATH